MHKLETEEDLKQLQDRIGLLGFYSRIMSEDEYRELSGKPEDVSALFHKLAKERLEAWVELAETRLKGTGIRCFVTGGNDDDPEVLEAIQGAGRESFFACEGQVVAIDDLHTMASVGFSNPTPWKTPREIPDEKLGEIIEGMCAQVKDFSHCIFNFHVPPLDSTLNSCPKLDWNTDPPSPIVSGGQIVFAGAGSRAVRNAIEKHQPLLGTARPYSRVTGCSKDRQDHVHQSGKRVRRGGATRLPRDPLGWQGGRLPDDQRLAIAKDRQTPVPPGPAHRVSVGQETEVPSAVSPSPAGPARVKGGGCSNQDHET